MMKSINEIIKDYREDSDMTQEAVANRIDVPRSTYARYEVDGTNLDLDVLLKLCKLYDVTPNDMLNYHKSPYLSNYKLRKIGKIITKYRMNVDVIIEILENIAKITKR